MRGGDPLSAASVALPGATQPPRPVDERPDVVHISPFSRSPASASDRSPPAPVQRQQLPQNIVVGDVHGPTVRGSHGRVKGCVRIGEPLRAGVVEVRQRALLERPRRPLVARNRPASDSRRPDRRPTRPTRVDSATGRATRPAVGLPGLQRNAGRRRNGSLERLASGRAGTGTSRTWCSACSGAGLPDSFRRPPPARR